MLKRILSTFIALCLLLSISYTTAFAAEAPTEAPTLYDGGSGVLNPSSTRLLPNSVDGYEYALSTTTDIADIITYPNPGDNYTNYGADGWGTNWIGGLTPDTTYYLFHRLAATGEEAASEAGANSLAVTTLPATGGTISITGTLQFGEMLTINTASLTYDGDIQYLWYTCPCSCADASMQEQQPRLISGATGATFVIPTDPAYLDMYIWAYAGGSNDDPNTLVRNCTDSAVEKRDYSGPLAASPTITDASTQVTYNSITIDAMSEDYEYAIVTTGGSVVDASFQSGGYFAGLRAETGYDIYSRYKATDSVKASDVCASPLSNVTTAAAPENAAAGTVEIDGGAANPIYGDTLSINAATWNTTGNITSADLSYQWVRYSGVNRVEIPGANAAAYTLTADDVGCRIAVTVYDVTGTKTGTVESAQSGVVDKATYSSAQIEAMPAPVIISREGTTLTLEAVAGYEYFIYSNDDSILADWQSGNVFTAIPTDATGLIFQRPAENATHYAPEFSEDFTPTALYVQITISVTTTDPTGADSNDGSITVTVTNAAGNGVERYNYSLETGDSTPVDDENFSALTTWTVSNLDEGAYEVFAEDYDNSGVNTVTQAVLLDHRGVPETPEAPTLQSKTYNSITLTPIDGNEYSIDGGATWQDGSAFAGLSESTEYSFVRRVKETDTNAASLASAALTVTTNAQPSGGNPSPGGVGAAEETEETERQIPEADKGRDTPIVIESEAATITFNGTAFEGLEGREVSIDVTEVTKDELALSEEQKEEIGDFPVFDISVLVDGERTHFESFEAIKIEIPLTGDYEGHKIIAVYVDENGNVEIMEGVVIDGVMTFYTNHLSCYTLMYADKSFEDVEDHWAQEAVEALAARSVTYGTTETTYSPEKIITRAEYVTLIVRYFNLTAYTNDFPYTNLEEGQWFTEPVQTARELGLLPDTYSEEFGPYKLLTREEMMHILYRALYVSNNYLNFEDKGFSLDDFSDADSISDYAYEGVEFLVSRDIIHGYDGELRLIALTTRAEVAQMLYNLLGQMFE